MRNILELVEQELEKRKLRAKDFYHDFCKLERENKKLQKENEILRNDLEELSQEYSKKTKVVFSDYPIEIIQEQPKQKLPHNFTAVDYFAKELNKWRVKELGENELIGIPQEVLDNANDLFKRQLENCYNESRLTNPVLVFKDYYKETFEQ